MSVKKVLIVGNDSGSIFGFRKELIETLVKENQVYVAAKLFRAVEKLKELGCILIDVDCDARGTNPLNDMKLVSEYKKILREIKPDIVLTYTIKPNVYAGMACAAMDVPYVANISGLGRAVENGGILQKITLPLYRRGLRKAQKVFFQNTENREFMLKHRIVMRNYDLLPGSGVNLEKFALLDYPEDETVNFVYMARLMKEKGIDQYIDAAKYIRAKYPYTAFHAFGASGEEYRKIAEKLCDEGILTYHGHTSDVISAYRFASCVVHPTFYPEGMSNVLLESCASGRPIITTDRAGCREIVDDGVNGFVVKQRSSEDLIEKIERFLSLSIAQRRQMGIEGRKKVEREFDRNVVIGKYMQEIEKV